MIFNKYKNFKAVFKIIFLTIIVMKNEKKEKKDLQFLRNYPLVFNPNQARGRIIPTGLDNINTLVDAYRQGWRA